MIKQVFEGRPRRAHDISIGGVRRRHRAEVARWVLANGRAMERDSLSLIIATREMNPDGTVDTTWSCGTVGRLLEWQADAWCATHHVPVPQRLGESLVTYLEYLRATRLLSEGSDPIEVLEDEIDHLCDDAGTVGSDGRPAVVNGYGGTSGRLIQLIPKKSNISASPS